MAGFIFGTVLPWVLLGVGSWIAYQIVRQNGRILIRLDEIEKRLAPRRETAPRPPRGLPAGSPAPEFALSDLAGVRHTLAEFRGRDLLVVFFNPRCGHCLKMAPALAALPPEGDDRHAPVIVITTGDGEENRRLFEKARMRGLVLLQESNEIATAYRAPGTPMGYRLDAQGRIAGELAIGAEALLALAQGVPVAAAPSNAQARPMRERDYRSLAGSQLKRDGLSAGTAAPEFRLPSLDGAEISLADFRGSRVLLVFSDPHCGPCEELAPRLEMLHQERDDLRVLVVSRGDRARNREKAQQLRLSYPIVLQKQWEVSKLYAKFATPVAYLVDAQGTLQSDVAVGVEPILALAGCSELPEWSDQPAARSGKEAAWAMRQ